MIVSTSPPFSVIDTNPPEPSPKIGTLVTVPVVEPPVIEKADPLAVINTVSILPFTEAFLTVEVAVSPHFSGNGI